MRPGSEMGLERNNVRGLETLGSLHHVELYGGAFLQVTVTISLNGGEVYKNVFSPVPLDESITFRGVEPLHRPLFSNVTHASN